jgi:type I restriction enzyme S subunit
VVETKDAEVLLPEFLPFVMQTESFHAHSISQSKGSVNPYINFSDLTPYEFELPPIESQRVIAELLNAADRVAETARDTLQCLDSVQRSWVEYELATLQRVWPVQLAGDLMSRLTVGIVVRPADLYMPEGNGVPALRSLNVLPDAIRMEDLVYISAAGHAEHVKSRLSPGDVVVVRSGRPGDAAVVPENATEMNCIDLIICSVGSDLLPHYVSATLNSKFGKSQFAAGTAGTAQKHFNVGDFRNLRVPLPPLSIQRAFVEQLGEMTRMRERAAHRLAEVRLLRTTLICRVFGP